MTTFVKYFGDINCLQMSQEFEMVVQKQNFLEEFEENFPLWCKAIIIYSKESQSQTAAIRGALRGLPNEFVGGKFVTTYAW